MNKRPSNQQPLKEVIDDWLEGHPMARKAKETRVAHLWGEILGPSVKNRTTSVRFSKGKLYVKLSSSVLRNELSFARSQIIQNLNTELGEEIIEEIVLK